MCQRCDEELSTAPNPWQSIGFRVCVTVMAGVGLLAVWLHGPLLDLHIYRMGGRAVLAGSDRLYDLRDAASGLAFTYPPFAALVFAPLAAIGRPAAEMVLTVASTFALAQVSTLIAANLSERLAANSVTAPKWIKAAALTDRRIAVLLIVGAACFEPTISTILLGQINLILMALVAQCLLRGAGRGSPILLGIAAGIKLTPAIFIVALWVCGRRLEAFRAASAAAATVAVGALLLPHSTLEFFTGAGFDDSRVGGVPYISNQSLNGSLWRLFGRGGNTAIWLALSAAVVVIGLTVAKRFVQAGDRMGSTAATALTGLMVSPISWSHHWVWIPMVVLALLVPLSPSRPNGPPWKARVRLILICSWVVAAIAWTVWWAPHGGDVEYHETLFQVVVGQSYLFPAIATLLYWLKVTAPSRRLVQATTDQVEVSVRRLFSVERGDFAIDD